MPRGEVRNTLAKGVPLVPRPSQFEEHEEKTGAYGETHVHGEVGVDGEMGATGGSSASVDPAPPVANYAQNPLTKRVTQR